MSHDPATCTFCLPPHRPEDLAGLADYAYRHPRSTHVAASRFSAVPHQAFAAAWERPAWSTLVCFDTRKPHGPQPRPMKEPAMPAATEPQMSRNEAGT